MTNDEITEAFERDFEHVVGRLPDTRMVADKNYERMWLLGFQEAMRAVQEIDAERGLTSGAFRMPTLESPPYTRTESFRD